MPNQFINATLAPLRKKTEEDSHKILMKKAEALPTNPESFVGTLPKEPTPHVAVGVFTGPKKKGKSSMPVSKLVEKGMGPEAPTMDVLKYFQIK